MPANIASAIWRFLAYEWQGPPDLPLALKMERRLVPARWIGILVVALAVSRLGLPREREVLGYVDVAITCGYNLVLEWMLRQRPVYPGIARISTVADGIVNIAIFVIIGGGLQSPYYFVLFPILVSVAMRNGYVAAVLLAAVCIGVDVLEHTFSGAPFKSGFLYRSGFLLCTTIVACYLREQAGSAETALRRRLGQVQARNDASIMLAASFGAESGFLGSLAAACHLLGADQAVMVCTAPGEPSVEYVLDPPSASTRLLEQLRDLASTGQDQTALPLRWLSLPDGDKTALWRVDVPGTAGLTATLAVGRCSSPPGVLDADIVESLQERMALAMRNASLYRALEKRSRDLQEAYVNLEVAHEGLKRKHELKTDFLANVSHEFRTPLSSLRSFSELMLDYPDPKVQNEFLEIITAESLRLSLIVEDVLLFTRIETGNLAWLEAPVALTKLVSESAERFGPSCEAAGLAFQAQLEDVPVVQGDADLLKNIVEQLLGNALKFTSSGKIALSLRCEGEEVLITVSDTGVGIAPEDQLRVFDTFQQIGPVLTQKPRGTGLGLSICQRIAEHHGGRIALQSEVGRGSTFTLVLPLRRRAMSATPSRSAAPQLASAASPD